MEEPQSPLQLQVADCRDKRIIGKIRGFLSSQASAINPSVIERRIRELFTSFETPTHPPYALMIQKAVKKLNERNGSNEESISEFIKNEFQDLPWAHSRILGLHLGKLCQAKELFRTERGRYMLMDDYYKFDERKEKGWRGGRRRKKNRRGRYHRGGETLERIEGVERCNDLHETVNEEQNHLSELHGTGTNEPIEEQGKSEIGQLWVTEECHGLVVPGQGQAETLQNENPGERIQEAMMELNDKISSSEIMYMEPHVVEKQNSMVIKLRIPFEKQPDNLRGGEILEKTEGVKRCNELQERDNEEQKHLSELHGTGTNEMIEEQGKSEIGQPGATEECHGRVVQGQGEAETRQNENTDECEKQIEATTKISRFCSDEISNNEKLSASLGSPNIAENQPDNLLAVAENQSLTQQIEAITEISRFCSDEISNNENLIASIGSPTIAENQCENQPDNLLAMAENQSLIQQIEATTGISRFCSDEISDNEKLSASRGSPTIAENQCENQPDNLLAVAENQSLIQQIEATTEISRFCSDEISGNENLSASLGSPTIAENQCENQPDNLLAVAENQSLIQQIAATTEISRFCSDEISDNENLSASLSSPTIAENQCENQPANSLALAENQSLTQQIEATTDIPSFRSDEISNDENLSATIAVIPEDKLQISEQVEQHQNETPSFQQKFSGACELLVVQEEGPEFRMETTCSSLPTAPDLPVDLTSDSQKCLTVLPISTEFLEHTPSEGIKLTPTQLRVQTSKCGTPETYLYAATKTLASMTVDEQKPPQADILGSPEGRVEENTTFGDLEKHIPIPQCIEWQPYEKSFADYPEVSLLPSDGSIADKQKPKYYKIKKQLQLRPQGQCRGRGRGRPPKLDRNPHQHNEQLQLQYQTLTSMSFPSLEPSETIYSLLAPNLPTAPNLQQLVDPTSEESPGCITRETSQLQLELQMSWNRLIYGDLDTTSKMEDSLSSMNGLEDKPQQHRNKGGPKRKLNLDGKTEFGHLEQQSPKRGRRGRPPKPVPTQDFSWVPVASSNNDIHGEKSPNFYSIVKNRKL